MIAGQNRAALAGEPQWSAVEVSLVKAVQTSTLQSMQSFENASEEIDVKQAAEAVDREIHELTERSLGPDQMVPRT